MNGCILASRSVPFVTDRFGSKSNHSRGDRRYPAILRHRGHRIERREAVIQSMDIQLTLDWHSGYRRYPPGLEPVIG